MLEFYPLPTNLNGGGLYAHHHHSHHHHHHAIGTTRFLDNTTNNCVSVSPATINATSAAINAAISTNNNNNNNNNNMQPQQQQQQQQQHLTDNNNSNSKKLSTIISTTSAAIVTAALAESTLTSYTDANISSTITCLPTACAATTLVPTAAATTTTTTIMVPPTNNNNSNNNNNNNNNSNNNKSSGDCSGRTEVDCIKCEKNFEICEGCGQKIHDRYLMNVGDTNWHEQCLACCYCGMQLHHTCYVRNMKLYCKLDYDRIFGIKCAACCHPVLPQEMVMRPIPNYVFHLSCFVCYACRLPLQKGEQFILRDGQLFCFRHDLEKELYLSAAAAAAQHCGYVGLDEDDLIRTRDGRRGPKRPRTILTSQQRKQFKASFDQSPKPCRKVREALAKDTGLSVRVVQVWFQNQRAKMKKIQRKAKNGGGTSSSTNNNERNADDKDKDKDDKSIKQESGSGSEGGGYLGLEQSFASQPLNPNLPFSPDDYPAHSNDSFCSSDLSLDGSNFDQLDDDGDSLSLNNFELQSTGSSSNHRQHSNPHDMIANLHTSLINPIDKLYLMQNSYFATE